ncbi:hypothetical protein CDAR_61041 [Caerostris darwini]|uniref:Uncharacterized protein n=1 Tax=Caerostris darwini TaxID=1538125 RepID=A0AAV4RXC1_9ARAC|nr:hypothetical protein CDAR_61041 [Caerostris darwini]
MVNVGMVAGFGCVGVLTVKPIQSIIDLLQEFRCCMYSFYCSLVERDSYCQYCFLSRKDKWKIELKRRCF